MKQTFPQKQKIFVITTYLRLPSCVFFVSLLMPRRQSLQTSNTSKRRRSVRRSARKPRLSKRRYRTSTHRRARGGSKVVTGSTAPCQFNAAAAYKIAPNSSCESCGDFSPDMSARTFGAKQPFWKPSDL